MAQPTQSFSHSPTHTTMTAFWKLLLPIFAFISELSDWQSVALGVSTFGAYRGRKVANQLFNHCSEWDNPTPGRPQKDWQPAAHCAVNIARAACEVSVYGIGARLFKDWTFLELHYGGRMQPARK